MTKKVVKTVTTTVEEKKSKRKKTKSKPKRKTLTKKRKKTTGVKKNNLEKTLLENTLSLQKTIIHLSENFKSLSSQISKLLNLFESSAKTLAEKELDAERNEEENREIIKKMETLMEQNKLIARGLTLMHGLPDISQDKNFSDEDSEKNSESENSTLEKLKKEKYLSPEESLKPQTMPTLPKKFVPYKDFSQQTEQQKTEFNSSNQTNPQLNSNFQNPPIPTFQQTNPNFSNQKFPNQTNSQLNSNFQNQNSFAPNTQKTNSIPQAPINPEVQEQKQEIGEGEYQKSISNSDEDYSLGSTIQSTTRENIER
jgi:hypothetical protein